MALNTLIIASTKLFSIRHNTRYKVSYLSHNPSTWFECACCQAIPSPDLGKAHHKKLSQLEGYNASSGLHDLFMPPPSDRCTKNISQSFVLIANSSLYLNFIFVNLLDL